MVRNFILGNASREQKNPFFEHKTFTSPNDNFQYSYTHSSDLCTYPHAFFCINVLFCIKGSCCQQRKSVVMQLCLVYDSISQKILSQNDFPQLDVAFQLTFASAWNSGIRSCQNHMTMLHSNTWLQALNIVAMFCFLLKLFQLFRTQNKAI